MLRPSEEVSMEVYARKPNKRERMILQQWLKENDLARYKRAQIILMSASGNSISEIAPWVGLSPERVRLWIHIFNRHGIRALQPRPRPGRPRKSNAEAGKELLYLLEHAPRDFGLRKARWTLADLAQIFSKRNRGSVSYVWVSRQLEKVRPSFKRSKRRTQSLDPDYFKKKKLSGGPSSTYARTRCYSSGMNRVQGERSLMEDTAGPRSENRGGNGLNRCQRKSCI